MKLDGSTAAVVGCGKSGRAALKVLLTCLPDPPRRIIVSEAGGKEIIEALPENLRQNLSALETGGHTWKFLRQADLIIISPGVPISHPAIAQAVREGIPVISELEFGYRLIDCPVVAVTGTNGKTTTTHLVGLIFEKDGRRVEVGGNIGRPLCKIVAEGKRADVVVLEVSSFQLETIDLFHAKGALLLNLTPDHLNRHGDFDTYMRTKLKIFNRQEAGDVAAVNSDDPVCRDLINAGTDSVLTPGGRMVLFSRLHEVPCGSYLKDDMIMFRSPESGGSEREIARLSDVLLRGGHNIENILGAVALTCSCDVKPHGVRKAIRAFEAVPHRLETVTTVNDVEFVNDSKATNVASTLCAIRAMDKPFILLLGGYDKGADFTGLAAAVAASGARAVIMGQTRERIVQALKQAGHAKLWKASDLSSALEKAWKIADKGDCILLSPGCASFDQFANFEQRGDVFKELVKGIEALEQRKTTV